MTVTGSGTAGGSAIVTPETIDRRDVGLGLFVAVLAVAFQWPIHDRWLSLQDEGYILAIADDLNRGKLLYRDVTSDAPFPGAFYLLAWWFRLVGPSVEGTRLLAVGGFAVYGAAIYRIGREVLSRRYSLGLVVALLCYRVWAFPHWHIYSYSLVAAVFITVATALVCVYRRSDRLGVLVLAGLFAGAGIMSKQNYGLAVTGALGLALLAMPWLGDRRRPGFLRSLVPGATLGLSALAVVVPTLWWFISQGALEAMIDQTWRYPFDLMNALAFTALPDLLPLWGQDAALRADIGSYFPSILATLWWYPCTDCFVSDMSRGPLYQSTAFWDVTLKLVYWTPILSYAIAAGWWGARFFGGRSHGSTPNDTASRLIVLAFAGGFLLAFNKPRDWVHLMMVYPPTLLVVATLLFDLARRLPDAARRWLERGLALGLCGALLLSLALMIDLRRQIDWPLNMLRGGVYADRQNGPLLDEIVSYVENSSSSTAPVPVYPVQPMIAFLAGRETAGGYYVVWPQQSVDRDQRIIADFEARSVRNVIYSVSQFQHLGSFRENAPDLFAYLVENFEVDRVFVRDRHGPIVMGLERERDRPGFPVPLAQRIGVRLRDRVNWERWPFARVLSAPVETPLRLPVSVPPDQTRLQFSYGVNPERWLGLRAGPLRFEILVEERGSLEEHLVFEAAIDPAERVHDRRWHSGAVDLSDYAGKTVFLTFTVTSDGDTPRPASLAGWGDPVFVRPKVAYEPVRVDG